MTVDLYGSAELMGIVNRIPTPTDFWLDTLGVFGRVYTSEKEDIYFDELGEEERRLAPFVAPLMQGKVMKQYGFNTKSFRPAYLKPKGIVDPRKLLTRRPGEALLGGMSLQERRAATVADIAASHRAMIRRRWDWMAAQAIMFGTVTISGDDYPTTVVDFGRHSSLTYTLAGNFRWLISGTPGTTADPLADIKAARTNAYDRSSVPVNTLVFGLTAWDGFQRNAAVQDLLNREKRNGNSDFRQSSLHAGEPWAYEGRIVGGGQGQGGFDCWTYRGTYRDDSGNSQDILNTHDVIGVGNVEGVRAFGAIMDMGALTPMDIFMKNYMQEDPSAEIILSQSAPLMVPLRPNASFRIRATAA